MIVCLVASVHYGDHSVDQLIASPYTDHTLHVYERLHQFLLLVSRERHMVVII